MMDLLFEIKWDEKNKCKKVNISSREGCSPKKLRDIMECLKADIDDLDFGKYEATFDGKNMNLKITNAEVNVCV